MNQKKSQYEKQLNTGGKQILAWVLKYTAEEFQEYSIEEIIESIEGTPEVGMVPVNPGLTNAPAYAAEQYMEKYWK